MGNKSFGFLNGHWHLSELPKSNHRSQISMDRSRGNLRETMTCPMKHRGFLQNVPSTNPLNISSDLENPVNPIKAAIKWRYINDMCLGKTKQLARCSPCCYCCSPLSWRSWNLSTNACWLGCLALAMLQWVKLESRTRRKGKSGCLNFLDWDPSSSAAYFSCDELPRTMEWNPLEVWSWIRSGYVLVNFRAHLCFAALHEGYFDEGAGVHN